MPSNSESKIVLISSLSSEDKLVTVFTDEEKNEEGRTVIYGALRIAIPQCTIWSEDRKYALARKIGGMVVLKGKDRFDYLKYRPDGKTHKRTLYRGNARKIWSIMQDLGFEEVTIH